MDISHHIVPWGSRLQSTALVLLNPFLCQCCSFANLKIRLKHIALNQHNLRLKMFFPLLSLSMVRRVCHRSFNCVLMRIMWFPADCIAHITCRFVIAKTPAFASDTPKAGRRGFSKVSDNSPRRSQKQHGFDSYWCPGFEPNDRALLFFRLFYCVGCLVFKLFKNSRLCLELRGL